MRWWIDLVAAWQDRFSLAYTVLFLLLGALIVALLWYFWPSWWLGLRRIRLRRRGAKRSTAKKAKGIKETVTEEEIAKVVDSVEELPDVAPVVFVTLADRFAAEGRYAEAVRERLRAIVRELVDRQIVEHRPGWTVTELARAAGSARPQVEPPVSEATVIFSDIWYAERAATGGDDATMRQLSDRVHTVLGGDR